MSERRAPSGVRRESKGVGDLLEAFATVRRRGVVCELQLMGQFAPVEFKGVIEERIRTLDLENDVTLLGVRTGRAKDECVHAGRKFYFADSNGAIIIPTAGPFNLACCD